MSPQYRGVPKPPTHLWDALETAHQSGDPTQIHIAEQHIHHWAQTNGYEQPQGTTRPDKATP